MRIIIIAMCILSLVGCMNVPGFNNTEKEIKKTRSELVVTSKDLDETAKILTTGAKEALESIPPENRSAEVTISLEFASQVERIIGVPIEKLDIVSIIASYKKDKKTFEADLEKQQKQITYLLKMKQGLELRNSILEEQAKRESTSKGFFGTIFIWVWNLSAAGIMLLVICIVLIAIFIPALLPRILGWIAFKIPQVIAWFGVTSVKIVDNLITGIQKSRVDISALPDDAKLSKKEILKLLEDNIEKAGTPESMKTVAYRKDRLKLIKTNKTV